MASPFSPAALILPVLAFSAPSALAQNITWHAEGRFGAVAAGHADAVRAGSDVLRAGGNAADAAATTLLALSVTDYGLFSAGGEVPLLIFDARRGQVKSLSGVGGAPSDPVAIQWLYENGIPYSGSMKAAPVPGAIDLVVTLLREYGTIGFARAVGPTLQLLDDGSADWHPRLAVTLRKLVAAEAAAGGSRVDGLNAVSECFYRGQVADELEAWYVATGALLRKPDLAAHRTLIEDPVSVDYRGYTVVKCGPWTQGPVLCQNLQLLEAHDLKSMGHLSADSIHVITEAMKLGYADRDEYYGDPRFTDVPMKALLSDDYAAVRQPLIDLHQASVVRRPGDPHRLQPLLRSPDSPAAGDPTPKQDTTTCVVADQWGNVIAATPSCNLLTNTPGPHGINTGNRVRSLNTAPGHPNRLEAGKRPRVTLTPTLVLKNGRPVIAISVAGGDLQDQTTLNVLVNHLDYGMSAREAVSAPRFHTNHLQDSFNPNPDRGRAFLGAGELRLNSEIQGDVQAALAARGHVVQTVDGAVGHPVMIVIDPDSGLMSAAGDPRAGRHAAALTEAP